MNHIIYLHGFLSSPESEKAKLVSKHVSRNHSDICLHMPTLSGDARVAALAIETLVSDLVGNKDIPVCQLKFIGSSMGGFLATYFVEKYGGKAVLINPAVEPFNLIQEYFGRHENPYTGEVFNVDESSVAFLHDIDTQVLSNDSKYYVLLQTGDETLDYRLAEKKYGRERCVTEDGGNHSFVNLEQHLRRIISFLSE